MRPAGKSREQGVVERTTSVWRVEFPLSYVVAYLTKYTSEERVGLIKLDGISIERLRVQEEASFFTPLLAGSPLKKEYVRAV